MRAQLIVRPFDLVVEAVDTMGQTSDQAKGLALSGGERGALVESGAGEEGTTAQGDAEDGFGRHRMGGSSEE